MNREFTLGFQRAMLAHTTGMGAGIITVVATKSGAFTGMVDIIPTATTTMAATIMVAGITVDVIEPWRDAMLGRDISCQAWAGKFN